MPRDGSGIYNQPFPNVVEGTTIESAVFNGNTADVVQDLNTPRPIIAGGTGANNAHDAMIALGGEIANQAVDNYDSFPFVSGSFWSVPGATSAPNSANYFSGICYTSGGLVTLEARVNTGTPTSLGTLYVRTKDNSGWSGWFEQAGSAADLDARYVNATGDTMTGPLTLTSPSGHVIAAGAVVAGAEGVSGQYNFGNSGGAKAIICDGVNFTVRGGPLLIENPNVIAGYASTIGSYYFGNSGTKALNYDGTNFNLVGGPLFAGSYGAGNTLCAGSITSAPNPTTGTFFFGTSGTKYLQYDGTNFNFAGGANVIAPSFYSGGPLAAVTGVTAGAGGATGTYYFGNTGTKYLQYDGTSFILTGGPLINSSGFIYNGLGSTGNYSYEFGDTGTKYLRYDGTNFNLSGGALNIPNGYLAASRQDGSYQIQFNDPRYRGYGFAVLSSGAVTFDDMTAPVQRWTIPLTGYFQVGAGYCCKGGLVGAFSGNAFNLLYGAGSASLWIDNTNLGNITVTSDYRIKKDVIDLPGMWDTVKALRPIKYTQAQYTPAIEIAHQAKLAKDAREHAEKVAKDSGEVLPAVPPPQPMFVADDIERWGFIAHELQETLTPSASTGIKDSPDTIQSPNPFTVIAALTKALQEAMTRIEALEAAR